MLYGRWGGEFNWSGEGLPCRVKKCSDTDKNSYTVKVRYGYYENRDAGFIVIDRGGGIGTSLSEEGQVGAG